MRWKLFTIVAGASFACCVATLALLVASHSVARCFTWKRELPVRVSGEDRGYFERNLFVAASAGQLLVMYSFAPPPDPAWMMHGPNRIAKGHFWSAPPPVGESVYPASMLTRIGFHFRSEDRTVGPFLYHHHKLGVPLWVFALAFAAAPARFFILVRREQRRAGFCRCGYDLRASPERCPECGASVPSAAAA